MHFLTLHHCLFISSVVCEIISHIIFLINKYTDEKLQNFASFNNLTTSKHFMFYQFLILKRLKN
jgi:hypothetical protein